MKLGKMPTPGRRTVAGRGSTRSSGFPTPAPHSALPDSEWRLKGAGGSQGESIPSAGNSSCKAAESAAGGTGGTLSPEWLEHGEEGERRRAGGQGPGDGD